MTEEYIESVEAAAVGAVIYNPGALDSMREWLQPSDFYLPLHQAMYQASLSLHERSEHVDPITVIGEIRRQGSLAGTRPGATGGRVDSPDAAYIASIYDRVVSPLAAETYGREVLELSVRRTIERAGVRLQSIGVNGVGDREQLIAQSRQVWNELADVSRRSDLARPSAPPERDQIAEGRAVVSEEDQMHALTLMYVEGWSYEKVADHYGVSREQVESWEGQPAPSDGVAGMGE